MTGKVIGNLLWRFLERCGAQLVSFVVSIILARILSPNEYGEIAIITVIIAILNVFIDGGFGNALIQKVDPDDIDYSTVFYFNVVLSFLMYGIVFSLAPIVGKFYSNDHLIPLLRVISISIIVSGVKNVQQAYVSKNFMFKKFFYATLGGTIVSAVLGIAMALRGFKTWALVLQYLSNTVIDTLILWIIVKWKPSKYFSFKRLKILFSYGYKLFLSSLINTFYENFRQLIIGRYYASSELAFYNKGKQFPALVMTNINTSIDSVLFPLMSEKQNDLSDVKGTITKSMNISTYVLWPIMFGMCAVAEPLVRIILTDQWIGSVIFMRIFCVVFATYPIQTANLNALKAVGRSDLFLKLEIEQTAVGVALLLIVMDKGVIWIAIMYLVATLIGVFLICHESSKVFNYSPIHQAIDLLPNFLVVVIMFIVVVLLDRMQIGSWFIFVEMLVGILVYISSSFLSKNKTFYYLFFLIKNFLK